MGLTRRKGKSPLSVSPSHQIPNTLAKVDPFRLCVERKNDIKNELLTDNRYIYSQIVIYKKYRPSKVGRLLVITMGYFGMYICSDLATSNAFVTKFNQIQSSNNFPISYILYIKHLERVYV